MKERSLSKKIFESLSAQKKYSNQTALKSKKKEQSLIDNQKSLIKKIKDI
jgi:hypothetical protein